MGLGYEVCGMWKEGNVKEITLCGSLCLLCDTLLKFIMVFKF